VLVATGLYAIEDGWLLSPGTIVLGVVAEHLGEPLLPHLLLLEPSSGKTKNSLPQIIQQDCCLVLGFPISQAEAQYCYDHGFNALIICSWKPSRLLRSAVTVHAVKRTLVCCDRRRDVVSRCAATADQSHQWCHIGGISTGTWADCDHIGEVDSDNLDGAATCTDLVRPPRRRPLPRPRLPAWTCVPTPD